METYHESTLKDRLIRFDRLSIRYLRAIQGSQTHWPPLAQDAKIPSLLLGPTNTLRTGSNRTAYRGVDIRAEVSDLALHGILLRLHADPPPAPFPPLARSDDSLFSFAASRPSLSVKRTQTNINFGNTLSVFEAVCLIIFQSHQVFMDQICLRKNNIRSLYNDLYIANSQVFI